MSFIPTYWYYEPVFSREGFELPPRGIIGPEPERIIALGEHGEIHGEAILMGRLPRPDFRYLGHFSGQVCLPIWSAVTLQSLKLALDSFYNERELVQIGNKRTNRRSHLEVEISDGKIFATYVHGNTPMVRTVVPSKGSAEQKTGGYAEVKGGERSVP